MQDSKARQHENSSGDMSRRGTGAVRRARRRCGDGNREYAQCIPYDATACRCECRSADVIASRTWPAAAGVCGRKRVRAAELAMAERSFGRRERSLLPLLDVASAQTLH